MSLARRVRVRTAAITITLLAVAACEQRAGVGRPSPHGYEPPRTETVTIRTFDAGVYGASGVVQLPDGRILVAGDDERTPLAIVDVFGRGASRIVAPGEIARLLAATGTTAINDLEALTIDMRGHVYAATSHSLTTKGVTKQEREQLVRFDVRGEVMTGLSVCTTLKAALTKLDPVFAVTAVSTPHDGGLNIEGIAWDPAAARLLIGFRSPREHGKALIVWLQNPDAVFDGRAAPQLSPVVALDLNGEGVRDLTYSPTLGAFLIVAGSWRHDKPRPPALWTWRGGDDKPVKLHAPDFGDLKPEGIAEVVAGDVRVLFVVSDDGNADESYSRQRALENHATPSRYEVLPIDSLRLPEGASRSRGGAR